MKKLVPFIFLIFSTLYVLAQEKDSIDIKIERMIEVLGTSQRFELLMDNLIELQKKNYSGSIDEEFWNLFRKEIKTNGYNEIIRLLNPIYKKHLTEPEIDAIITFYESETGQKMVRKFPLISEESMKAGAEWGEKLGQQINEKIKTSHELKFNTVLNDCSAFKEGKFTYSMPDGTVVKLTREGNVQTEISKKGELKGKLEWTSECSYKLWELDEDYIEGETNPYEVNIYEINGNSCKFISRMEGYDFFPEGELQKVED